MPALLNTHKKLSRACFCILMMLVITSCGNANPTVTALTLLYECQGPLADPNNTREFSVALSGKMDYVAVDGSSQTQSFSFNTPKDFMEICIHDRASVDPGRSYDLLLIHVDSNGDLAGNKSKWPLHVINNTDNLLKTFCFRIQPDNGELSILPGTPVAGSWRILHTDREITANYRTSIRSKTESKSSSPANCGP
ncbi:hypothetical protein PUR31_01255 [Pseudomonas mosselii]|uniref:hypothetical protein n=1 Tax=unclassified Pseudomonas TaxID=196821 RepID=UPI001F46DF36|nr:MULTISPECIES: hypothetical protein [unclassified Pseudomonas]MCF1486407.1 hypothetical protein [Pseudomonas sp. AA27]MCP8634156.1 hypothetical protein [Pseudomonas sp. DVZ6]MDD7782718.1 hypothetical protein [Pseudomonas sp. DVZ24]